MGEAGQRRCSRLPAPPPRPAPASRADQVPRTRGPASPSRTGCSARLSRPGLGGGWGGGVEVAGELGPEQRPRGSAESWAPDPSAPLFSPPGPRPGDGDGRGPGALSTPSEAPLWPDVGGCGGRAAARGRRRVWAGERFLPFPGVQGSFCGRFYLRSQTKFAAAFARSAPARVKRSGRRPAGSRPVGLQPREACQGPHLTKMLAYGNPKDNGRREQTSEARMLARLCFRVQ